MSEIPDHIKSKPRTLVVVDYGGHSVTTPWVRSEKHCPNCGVQSVHRTDDGGDYYEGELHCCTSCEHSFSIPSLGPMTSDGDKQILSQLNASRTDNKP